MLVTLTGYRKAVCRSESHTEPGTGSGTMGSARGLGEPLDRDVIRKLLLRIELYPLPTTHLCSYGEALTHGASECDSIWK
jgi:hypothetical protein